VSSTQYIAISQLTNEQIIVEKHNTVLLVMEITNNCHRKQPKIVHSGEEEKRPNGCEIGKDGKTIESGERERDGNLSSG